MSKNAKKGHRKSHKRSKTAEDKYMGQEFEQQPTEEMNKA